MATRRLMAPHPPAPRGRPAGRRRRSTAPRPRRRRAGSPPGRRGPAGSARVPHTRATTGTRSASAASGGRQHARGVAVRAVAEHDVEQHAAEPVLAAARSSSSMRTSRSTIGCGRPWVYSSSPRSRTRWVSASAWPCRVAGDRPERRGQDRRRLLRPASRRRTGRGRAPGAVGAALVDCPLELVDGAGAAPAAAQRRRLERRVHARTAPSPTGGPTNAATTRLSRGTTSASARDDLGCGRLRDEQQRLGLVVARRGGACPRGT